MNPYEGKICPFCKTEFQPDDEIVLCSECDMPHHKECWAENQGCTTFGCQGTIKAPEDAAPSAAARPMAFGSGGRVYCTRCGAPSPDTALFCAQCGNRLTTAPQPQRPPQPPRTPVYTREDPAPYTREAQTSYAWGNYYSAGAQTYSGYSGADVAPEIRQLVGDKAAYYIPRFQQMKRQGKQTSWNWAAFLVAPYWMIYRKMYAYGGAVLGAGFLLSLLGTGFATLLSLAGYIALGIFGNGIYLKFLEGKADRARTMSQPMRADFLAQNSGTNLTATVLTVIGYLLFSVIIAI